MENGDDLVKRKILIALLIFCCFLLNACTFSNHEFQSGNSDWSYKLPNGYVIWHINSRKIVCGKKETENSISNIGGDYVLKFCYNNIYVCLQCVDVSDDLSKEIDEAYPQFYIINTEKDEIVGPLFETQYIEKINSINLNNLSSWIKTKPAPNGASFP